ncbi:MAG TPA: hypothetical protein VGX16_07615, partial [Solirubrobacteraceae bacterium]|nr:hypothetical protein [Solirubrobacteraceae bacterium]
RMLLSPEILTPTPLDTVASAHALARAPEGGLLLLDTPPVSPADRTRTHAISGLLSTLGVDRVLLALPATLGARAAGQLLGALAPLGACAVAITHADETDQLAVAVEACCRFGLAPEYLLERARPGGSFQRIDPNYLAERLLK